MYYVSRRPRRVSRSMFGGEPYAFADCLDFTFVALHGLSYTLGNKGPM